MIDIKSQLFCLLLTLIDRHFRLFFAFSFQTRRLVFRLFFGKHNRTNMLIFQASKRWRIGGRLSVPSEGMEVKSNE